MQHSALAQPAQPAQPSPPSLSSTREAFDAASERIASDPAGAAIAFLALADAHPDDDYAADALLEAAELDEERLALPDRALALYERILSRYPDSRLALRARARREFLAPALRTGAAPLAEFQDILLHYAGRPADESTARMERLVAAHPDFALADRALLWLASSAAQAGRFEIAIDRYSDVERRWPRGPTAREAQKGRADTLLAAGRALQARHVYRALATSGDRATAEAAERGVEAADLAIGRSVLLVAAFCYLALFVAFALRVTRRRLLPLPFELKFYLPVAALFALAALSAQPAALGAVALIGVGGALIIWLGGAAARRRLERGALSIPRRALQAAATGIAVIALTYAALHTTRMIDVTVETLRYGAER